MKKISTIVILLLTAAAAMWGPVICPTACVHGKGQIMNGETKAKANSRPGVSDLTIKVVYDNNTYTDGMKTDWGFSCLITGTEKTILFDTGGDGLLLLDNIKKLAIDPNSIDVVVLSHIHSDHTGGLDGILEKKPRTDVYLPKSFPEKFKENIQKYGAETVEVEQPLNICENVYSAGQLGKLIKEQSLIIRTSSGLIVITGCAHPGIVKIVKTVKDLMKEDILLVMGGFHLEWATKGRIEKIISSLRECKVQYVAPCHCTGDKARTLFEKHFGKNYINVGAGKTITMADLR